VNTVQHKTKTIEKHTITMEGPITARDLGDFQMQVNNIFEKEKGRPVRYDDDYYVTGNEDGLTATFETES